MASEAPWILRRTIDDDVLRDIYASDQEMYPAPLSFERLRSWAKACPELSQCFYTLPEGTSSPVDLGAVIALPIRKDCWEQLLAGELKESGIDPTTMFPSQDMSAIQSVGVHIFHIEKFPDFAKLGRIKHFAAHAMSSIREIATKSQWNILGYSALTATTAGRLTFERMGFTLTGYEEVFVRKEADSSRSGDVEMVYIYPHDKDLKDLSRRGSVLSQSQMTVKYGNDGFWRG